MYFCTIKDHDGANDKASQLSRSGIYRIAIGIGRPKYVELFGPKPKRPKKGEVVDLPFDFAKTNSLMPHPVYAWMGWAQILSPDREVFEAIFPLIVEAHAIAVKKFDDKLKK